MNPRRFLILTLALLTLPIYLNAQPPREERRRMERRRTEIEQRIHTMKIWKMTEELQLSQDQAAKFFPLVSELDRDMETLERERGETLGKLGDLIWEEPTQLETVKQLLAKLREFDQKQLKRKEKFTQDATNVLQPLQMAKLALFNARFPDIVHDLIRELDERREPRGPNEPREPRERRPDPEFER